VERPVFPGKPLADNLNGGQARRLSAPLDGSRQRVATNHRGCTFVFSSMNTAGVL
jgi:hypothetical protein